MLLVLRVVCSAGSSSNGAQSVEVTVERGARNSRRLYAAVQIAAPIDIVWGALTDYEGLGNFIPGANQSSICESFATVLKEDGAIVCQADLHCMSAHTALLLKPVLQQQN